MSDSRPPIDKYISKFPEDVKNRLQKIREVIKEERAHLVLPWCL